jgi:hypothetical protein
MVEDDSMIVNGGQKVVCVLECTHLSCAAKAKSPASAGLL